MLQNCIGDSNIHDQLQKLEDENWQWDSISRNEYKDRIERACRLMELHAFDAVYLHAGTNLYYFTGMRWSPSERMVGALLTRDGILHFIAPRFEYGTMKEYMLIEGKLHCWEEHESPYQLFSTILQDVGPVVAHVGIDESCPFFISDGLAAHNPNATFSNAQPITAGCRMYKSAPEIAIIQTAMDMTLAVQKSTAKILRPGISPAEVKAFIDEAHKSCGAPAGSYFCIVLFGVDSSYPHGVIEPQNLQADDVVLIDTGCQIEGYISDITRSYVYGEISDEARRIWDIEKALQLTAFAAAQNGMPCSYIDLCVRRGLTKHQLGPDYQLPGTPHRTGHGIGLDIHEWPYIALHDEAVLAPGMTFSIEPMVCVPGQFGIRLEDHIYMTEDGPRWFTTPAVSIDHPFG